MIAILYTLTHSCSRCTYTHGYWSEDERHEARSSPTQQDHEWVLKSEFDKLQAQLTQEREAFKNFHRLICEASGYTHDDIEWERDQASLAEHIRAKYVKGKSE